MRIRSIRPEFWRSSAISSLSLEDRLLFIGLWSYVDDNGVGLDKLSAVAADLFADDVEANPSETFARVSRGLASLSEAGRIIRYTVDGRDYLHVTNWSEHQKIDKPGKARFPLPDSDSATIRETVATPSRESLDISGPGEGEKGRRGEGDSTYVGGDAPAAQLVPNHTETQTLIAEWIEHCDTRPPGQVVGQLSKQIKRLLDEGQPYQHVRAGVAAWARKGLHPSTLPSVVHETRTPRRPKPAGGIDWDAAMARAAERDRTAS